MTTTLFTKPAVIKHQGVRFALGTLEQMLAIEGEMRERPSFVRILACKSCKVDGVRVVCTHEAPCPCCEMRKRVKRSTGGEHIAIIEAAEFLERLRAYEATVNA